MRTLLLAISLLIAAATMAQNGMYEQAMGEALAAFGAAKTADELNEVSNTFERIAKAEGDKWQPYYYAAFTRILRTHKMGSNPNVDAVLDEVDGLVASAEVISPNNSELYCLKSMSATGRMLQDPQNRGMQYGPISSKELGNAIKANPDNPRAYLLQAQSTFYTPAMWGGGKDKAKPQVEKSLELFKTSKTAHPFDPNWGQDMAEKLLKQCE